MPAHKEHAFLKRALTLQDAEKYPVTDPPLSFGGVTELIAASRYSKWMYLGPLHEHTIYTTAIDFAANVMSGGSSQYVAQEFETFQPAPQLRSIARHVVNMLREQLLKRVRSGGARKWTTSSALRRSVPISKRQRVGRRGSSGSFDCLHVRRRQWANATLLRQAAGALFDDTKRHPHYPVLLVGEDGIDDDALLTFATQHVPSLFEMPMTVLSVLPGAVRVSDFYPHWDLVEISDASGARTLAYDVVQQLVCSQAEHIVGQPSSPFVAAACYWRAADALGFLNRTQLLASDGRQVVGRGRHMDTCIEIMGRAG
mmetsp:Transcript_30575/g.93581  ORF Transcript_30575/g.93581 Transcript_30575/m.93581 type:complete len:313 (+) Transcript_30575:3138-4076(+)